MMSDRIPGSRILGPDLK